MNVLNPKRGVGLPLFVPGKDARPQCIYAEDWDAVDWQNKGRLRECQANDAKCRNCGDSPAYGEYQLCGVCANYQRRHGMVRPQELIERARAQRRERAERA